MTCTPVNNAVGFVERMTCNESKMNYYWIKVFAHLGCYAAVIGSWLLRLRDSLSVRKRRQPTTNQCCITSQKNDDLIDTAAEALNHIVLNYWSYWSKQLVVLYDTISPVHVCVVVSSWVAECTSALSNESEITTFGSKCIRTNWWQRCGLKSFIISVFHIPELTFLTKCSTFVISQEMNQVLLLLVDHFFRWWYCIIFIG
jgi:hypothetical protein